MPFLFFLHPQNFNETLNRIPDFRSAINTVVPTGPGVWELRDHPGAKRSSKAKVTATTKAIPSPTHMALVELARRNILKFVVSQNTDGLHLRSGLQSNLLAELHGNSNLETCKSCRSKYLRDFRTRTAKRVHDHKTTRQCPKCKKFLYDSIINFGENLPEYELETSFEHAEKADVCLVLGSSLRVTPAANIPERVGERRQKLAIANLQETPLSNLAQLNIHALCDEIMIRLLAKLDIPIPEWKLHRRVRIDIDKESIIVFGLDLNQDIPYSLFSSVKVAILNGTSSVFPSTQIRGEEPFKHKFQINEINDKMTAYVELNWQGHYNEPKYTVKLPWAKGNHEFHLFYNPFTKTWNQES